MFLLHYLYFLSLLLELDMFYLPRQLSTTHRLDLRYLFLGRTSPMNYSHGYASHPQSIQNEVSFRTAICANCKILSPEQGVPGLEKNTRGRFWM
jgi:hypothetical protein